MTESEYEKTIKKLFRAQHLRPLSTRKISAKTQITWPTTRKYLQQMRKEGELTSFKQQNKIMWQPSGKTAEQLRKEWRRLSKKRNLTLHNKN